MRKSSSFPRGRMSAALCTVAIAAPIALAPYPVSAEGLFDFLLDGIGVLLDLESAVVGAFVGQFEEVPGHGAKIRPGRE